MSPDKAAKQAANLLMLAFKNIVPDDYTVGAGHFRKGPSGQNFVLSPVSIEAAGSAARKLIPFIDYFPLEKCSDRLIDFVVEEKDVDTALSQVHEHLRQKVVHFLRGFASQGEWELVIAVNGINVSEGPFSLGECSFYLMDDQRFALWGRRFASGRYNPTHDDPLFQSWLQYEGALRGQVVAAARVRATDHDHAKVKGRSRVEEAVNVLRYAQLANGFGFATLPAVGLSVKQDLDDHCIVIRLDKIGCQTSRSGGRWGGFQLSMLRNAPGWNELENLICLDLSARNEVHLRLSTALEWIGQATVATSRPIRLVALVTALEALLIDESETSGKKTKLAKRVSRLIAESDAEIPGVVIEIEEIYKTRSECVHAGLLDVEKAEIDRAERFVTKTITAILTTPQYRTANALEDILAQIDPPLARSDQARSRWIAENAFFRWLNEGRLHDRHVQHWIDAEREFICTNLLRGRPLDSVGTERQAENEEEQT